MAHPPEYMPPSYDSAQSTRSRPYSPSQGSLATQSSWSYSEAPPAPSQGSWDPAHLYGPSSSSQVSPSTQSFRSSAGSTSPPSFYENHGQSQVSLSQSSVYSASTSTSIGPNVPFGSPPGYRTARRPTTPIIYTLSPISFNSMIVVPPADAADSRPQYHISVSMNCFIPSSFITTIRRGATEFGEHVGDFELGISDVPETLCIRGKEFILSSILGSDGNKLGQWQWKFVKKALHWDCTKIPKVCYNKERKVVYAKFTPSVGRCLREPGTPPAVTQLEIFPEGQELFDDILISALIIERRRLTPNQFIPAVPKTSGKKYVSYYG